MAEMIGAEGSLVHLVEGGEEIVGVESDSVHLAQGEEEMMCIDWHADEEATIGDGHHMQGPLVHSHSGIRKFSFVFLDRYLWFGASFFRFDMPVPSITAELKKDLQWVPKVVFISAKLI